MLRLGVVVSNYNNYSDTIACLKSLEQQTFQDFEVILLDDGSSNDSACRLAAELKNSNRIVFLPQQINRGFAAANNVGIRRALHDGCKDVLLLNSDTVCAPDMLETLLQQTPAGAVACPKMLFLESPREIWFAGGTLDRNTLKARHFGGHQVDKGQYETVKKVNFISFCCVLLPDCVIRKVGMLNEELFMYCEDVDYCIRLADSKVDMWYLPKAKLWHKAGASSNGVISMYYITRNTLSLSNRHCTRFVRWLHGMRALIPSAVRYGTTRLMGRPKGRSYGIYLGTLDFLRGKTGRMDIAIKGMTTRR
jgi:GT2 family glycosyltransferase